MLIEPFAPLQDPNEIKFANIKISNNFLYLILNLQKKGEPGH